MPGSCRAMKFSSVVLVAAAILAGSPTLSHAATGSVRITISRAQFVVGGGTGILRFQSERYPLRVGGVSVGPFGAARVDLVGRAYNMQTAASIHGTYTAIADGAGTGRAGVVRFRNWQGVLLELRGRGGVKPAVDLSGLQISLR